MRNRIGPEQVITWDNLRIGVTFHAACAATWAAMLLLGLWQNPADNAPPTASHHSPSNSAPLSQTATQARASGRTAGRTLPATLAGFESWQQQRPAVVSLGADSRAGQRPSRSTER